MNRSGFEQAARPQALIKTNSTAIFGLISSLLGYFCLLGIGGALGLVLGLIARGEIAKSEGREGGRGIANGAIVLGALNLVLPIIAFGVALTYLTLHPTSRVTATRPRPSWVPTPSPPATSKHTRPGEPRASRMVGTDVTTLGRFDIADIGGDFATELSRQRVAADEAREALVLWVIVRDCKSCDGVAAALSSPLLQKAVGPARFVRVDRDDYEFELERLGIPTEKIPGFAILGAQGHVRDFIDGGEWDADIARNIAPVLGKFVHGRYRQRRHPWHGSPRPDDTPL